MIHFFVAIFIFLFTAWAQAQTSEAQCQKMNLRDKFGPVRHQGNLGWCYANAAADLLSYHYRDELHNEPVSAIYVALKFNYTWWAQNLREGGIMYLALEDAMENGLCPARYDLALMNNGHLKTLKEKMNFILKLKDEIDKGNVDYVKAELQKSYKAKSVLREMQLYDLMTLIAISPKEKVLGNIADAICSPRRHAVKKFANRKFSTKYLGTTRYQMIQEINENLDHANPVGLAYFADFFEAENAPHTNEGRHMSVVIGREWNKSKQMCEYWVRNSWGPNCTGYKNEKVKAACRGGYLLIPENVLHENIFGISYLTD